MKHSMMYSMIVAMMMLVGCVGQVVPEPPTDEDAGAVVAQDSGEDAGIDAGPDCVALCTLDGVAACSLARCPRICCIDGR